MFFILNSAFCVLHSLFFMRRSPILSATAAASTFFICPAVRIFMMTECRMQNEELRKANVLHSEFCILHSLFFMLRFPTLATAAADPLRCRHFRGRSVADH